MDSNEFIFKLYTILPDGFEAKKFNKMPRIHIKYSHYGFAVIDLNKYNYNLFVLGGMFTAVGVQNFERISNMSNKTNRIMHIPYDDTDILEKLFAYVEANPSSIESVAVQSY
jgi:hypothetical protein